MALCCSYRNIVYLWIIHRKIRRKGCLCFHFFTRLVFLYMYLSRKISRRVLKDETQIVRTSIAAVWQVTFYRSLLMSSKSNSRSLTCPWCHNSWGQAIALPSGHIKSRPHNIASCPAVQKSVTQVVLQPSGGGREQYKLSRSPLVVGASKKNCPAAL
jgi:hypothetical protein